MAKELVEKKEDFLKDTKNDVWFIDIRKINIIEGFNVRFDYGDMDELVTLIRQNGVRVPLRAFEKDGKWFLVDGHRRLKACQIISDNDNVDMRVPVIKEPKNATDEKRLLDMLVLNDGKELNLIEQSEIAIRLSNFNYTDKEICDKTAWSKSKVFNLKRLGNFPKDIKQLIVAGVIAPTLVLQILTNSKGDADKASEHIRLYIDRLNGKSENENPNGQEQEQEQKPKKITGKTANKIDNKQNTFQYLKKIVAIQRKNELAIPKKKQDLWNFVVGVVEKTSTMEQMAEYLLEVSLIPEQMGEEETEKLMQESDK